MNYVFVFTAGIMILNLWFAVSIWLGNALTLPYQWYTVKISPHVWWIFYPSFFYQVYWWSVRLELITF